jgi:hypothetical protein
MKEDSNKELNLKHIKYYIDNFSGQFEQWKNSPGVEERQYNALEKKWVFYQLDKCSAELKRLIPDWEIWPKIYLLQKLLAIRQIQKDGRSIMPGSLLGIRFLLEFGYNLDHPKDRWLKEIYENEDPALFNLFFEFIILYVDKMSYLKNFPSMNNKKLERLLEEMLREDLVFFIPDHPFVISLEPWKKRDDNMEKEGIAQDEVQEWECRYANDILTKEMAESNYNYCLRELDKAKKRGFEIFSETFQQHYGKNKDRDPKNDYIRYYPFNSQDLIKVEKENQNKENNGWVGISASEALHIDDIPILCAADLKKICWFVDIGHVFYLWSPDYSNGWVIYQDKHKSTVELFERLNEQKEGIGLFFREMTKAYLDAIVKKPGIGLPRFGMGVNLLTGEGISYNKTSMSNKPYYTSKINRDGKSTATFISEEAVVQEQQDRELRWLLGLTEDYSIKEVREEAQEKKGFWQRITKFFGVGGGEDYEAILNANKRKPSEVDKKRKESQGDIKSLWQEFISQTEEIEEERKLGFYLALIGRNSGHDMSKISGYLRKFYQSNKDGQIYRLTSNFMLEEQVIAAHRLLFEMKNKYFIGDRKLYLFLAVEIKKRVEKDQGIFRGYNIDSNDSLKDWISEKLLNEEEISEEKIRGLRELWRIIKEEAKERFVEDLPKLYISFRQLKDKQLRGKQLLDLSLEGLRDIERARKSTSFSFSRSTADFNQEEPGGNSFSDDELGKQLPFLDRGEIPPPRVSRKERMEEEIQSQQKIKERMSSNHKTVQSLLRLLPKPPKEQLLKKLLYLKLLVSLLPLLAILILRKLSHQVSKLYHQSQHLSTQATTCSATQPITYATTHTRLLMGGALFLLLALALIYYGRKESWAMLSSINRYENQGLTQIPEKIYHIVQNKIGVMR